MSRREAWCQVAEEVYTSRDVRRPAQLGDPHVHHCPDRTRVVVTAQYIPTTDMTLYRWEIGGVLGRPTRRSGDWQAEPPDWSAVDALHAVAA